MSNTSYFNPLNIRPAINVGNLTVSRNPIEIAIDRRANYLQQSTSAFNTPSPESGIPSYQRYASDAPDNYNIYVPNINPVGQVVGIVPRVSPIIGMAWPTVHIN